MISAPCKIFVRHFLTPFPKSLLSANANDFENRHEAWVRGPFSLDRVNSVNSCTAADGNNSFSITKSVQ